LSLRLSAVALAKAGQAGEFMVAQWQPARHSLGDG